MVTPAHVLTEVELRPDAVTYDGAPVPDWRYWFQDHLTSDTTCLFLADPDLVPAGLSDGMAVTLVVDYANNDVVALARQ